MDLLMESLSRTMLLMRDELREEVTDEQLLTALTQTDVVLTADAANLSSHPAQCAFVTAALTMARSGHRVCLVAPDLALAGIQPPLELGGIVTSLMRAGRDLLPGISFSEILPRYPVDLVVALGDTPVRADARRVISINASAWSAHLQPLTRATPWRECYWPSGAMAAGALAAGEAFKLAMMRLEKFARVPGTYGDLFAPGKGVEVELAPENTPITADLGGFDVISAGAITNALLYCLARLPKVRGRGRLIEDSTSDYSNLNRYALLLRSAVSQAKAQTLAEMSLGGLELEAVPLRYTEQTLAQIRPHRPRVLVGVDHIPSRWLAQRAWPSWLGIGATTHWNSMSSFHIQGLACARYLHSQDDPDDNLIPTVSFVSFWAGLQLSTQLLRSVAGDGSLSQPQHDFFTPMRPESIWRAPVAIRLECPDCGRLAQSM